MNSRAVLPKKNLYLILIPCAIIIFSSSIETMMRVKDISLYNQWSQSLINSNNSQMSYDQSFDAYLIMNLTYYIFKIIIPIFLSINTYFAYTHTRVNKLFIFVWVVFVLGGLSYVLVEQSFYSIFYYINIAAYIILVLAILYLNKFTSKSKTL